MSGGDKCQINKHPISSKCQFSLVCISSLTRSRAATAASLLVQNTGACGFITKGGLGCSTLQDSSNG